MEDWKEFAELQEDVRIDIGFMVQETFYYGPENGFSPEQYENMRVSLYLPEIKKSGNFVLYTDILGKESELKRHYLDVADKCKKYKKDVNKSTHFWNRPVIYNTYFVISFPWHDKFREGKNVLENIATTTDGEVYWDRDQGWELEIIGEGGLLFAREWDPDYEEIHCQVKFDRAGIRQQAFELIPKVSSFIRELTSALGKDYWT